MSVNQHELLIGPQSEPPPFARSQPRSPGHPRGGLPTKIWRPLIQRICGTGGVDPIRTEAMMLLESGGQDLDPNVDGAVGLMQIIPSIWPELCEVVCESHGVPNLMTSWRTPEINIEIGVRELKWWIEEKCGGSGDGGTCAYFSGHCIPNGAEDNFNTSDEVYVNVVRANMDLVRQDMSGDDPTDPVDDVIVSIEQRFNDDDQIEVFDGPLNLRAQGNLSAQIVASLPTATIMTVTGGPVHHDGLSWYRVNVAVEPGRGWVAGQFCRLINPVDG